MYFLYRKRGILANRCFKLVKYTQTFLSSLSCTLLVFYMHLSFSHQWILLPFLSCCKRNKIRCFFHVTAVLFPTIMSTETLCFLLWLQRVPEGVYLNIDKCRFPLCCTLKSRVVCLDIDVKKTLRNELHCIFYCWLWLAFIIYWKEMDLKRT